MIKDILNDIDAVIFDMDGSLVDSMWIWKQVDIDYFASHGKILPDDLQSRIEGMSFYQTAQYFKDNFRFTDSVEKMMDIWNEMAHEKYAKEVPFKKGVEHFLDLCVDRGIKLGIATSNSRYLYDAVACHLGLDRYFKTVLTGSEILNGKPAPDVYLTCAERLDVDPSRCLVFEDITKGIEAGHNAGMKVCAVDDEYSLHQREDKKSMADYFIHDFTELEF